MTNDDDYGYDPAPRRPEAAGSDHGRVVTSGAWMGALAGTSLLGLADMRIPGWCAFLLNWTICLAVCYFMARWKRAWYAWAAFWGMAAVCLLAGILTLAGLMHGQLSAASWWVACAMVFVWYWLVRIPRLQPAVEAVERREVHVIHHVIHHGPELPGRTAAEMPAAPARKVIAGSARAIGPAARKDQLSRVRDGIRKAITGTAGDATTEGR